MTGAPLLISYAYYAKHGPPLFAGSEPPRLFLDSGAFSAMTQGATIDLADYCDWIGRWSPIAYSNLDVVRQPRQTAENQAAMEARGLRPIPVFHAGSPWTELDALLEAGYDYIAFGGLVPHAGSERLRKFLIHGFDRVGPGVRVHGFGIGAEQLLYDFPFYSADSSRFGSGFRYGRFHWLDERGKITHHAPKQAAALGRKLRNEGIDPQAIAAGRGSMYSPFRLNALRWGLLYAERLRARMELRHGVIPAPTNPPTDRPGPLMFISDSSADNARIYASIQLEAA